MLKQAIALLEMFQKQYVQVWNGITAVKLRLADALTLVPKLRFLVDDPKFTTSHMASIYDTLEQMKKDIVYTIDQDKVQLAMQGHDQVGDLLDRTIKCMQDIATINNIRFDSDTPSLLLQDSANEFMSASLILVKFFEEVM